MLKTYIYTIERYLVLLGDVKRFSEYRMIHDKSAAQAPEKLYREKWLMLYVVFLCILFVILLEIDIPAFDSLMSKDLIRMQ